MRAAWKGVVGAGAWGFDAARGAAADFGAGPVTAAVVLWAVVLVVLGAGGFACPPLPVFLFVVLPEAAVAVGAGVARAPVFGRGGV